jgi:hypothetical protein
VRLGAPTAYGKHRLTRTPRCGKCGAIAKEIIETIMGTSTFDIIDGTHLDAEGYHEPGDIIRVDAKCACGHRWRLRGAATVDSIREAVEVPK